MENKIEQIYKQKFDKLLAKAKHIYNNENDVLIRHTIEELFPEIRESEDEKIRKELIKHLQEGAEGYEPAGGSSDYKRWLTWVKKQDELVNSLSKGLDNAHERIDKLIQKNNELCVKLEKQGEQEKDILEDAILDGYILDDDEDGLIAETIRYKNKKRGGQKYAYKVKPKFNIGDWITNGIDVNKIIGIDLEDENYLFENGRKSDISLVDSNSHLWTIRDAKDGDVLAGSYGTFIFMGKSNGGYCGVLSDSTFIRSTGNNEWTEDLHPATKEQRDLLFQKMNEMGYEWDVKKKELKKIVAPIFHIGDRVRYKGHVCDGVITEITETDYICGDAKLPISTQDKLELVEQKTAWGGENEIDKEILNAAILFVMNSTDEFACNGVSKDDVIDWLKSLRPQNTYNPYKAVVESIAEMCKHYDKASHSGLRDFYDNVKVKCKDAHEYDKMFPQAQWKPSDEQIHCLKQAIDSYTFEPDYLEELYQDLKKLKEE